MFEKIVLPLAILVSFLTFSVGIAHEDVHGPVGERMQAMSDMGRAMKGLSATARSGDLIDNPEADVLIEQLRQKAGTIEALFVDPAMVPSSEALPNIWSEKPRFNIETKQFGDLVETLQLAYEAGDEAATLDALRQVGRGCGSCHQQFRKP